MNLRNINKKALQALSSQLKSLKLSVQVKNFAAMYTVSWEKFKLNIAEKTINQS